MGDPQIGASQCMYDDPMYLSYIFNQGKKMLVWKIYNGNGVSVTLGCLSSFPLMCLTSITRHLSKYPETSKKNTALRSLMCYILGFPYHILF